MEIERKYLVNFLPEGYDACPFHEIEQAYLCTEPVIRIRTELVTAENLKKGDYDRVILATGSAPVLLSGGRIWTLPICTGMGYNGCL